MTEDHIRGSLYALVDDVLAGLGYHGDDPHFDRTPERFIDFLWQFRADQEPFKFTTFPNTEGLDSLVVVGDIPFYSMCAHHMVPFIGKAHVGYIPDQEIAGISKLARAVEYFARRLTVQETITNKIVELLVERLAPLGCGVVMQAEHLCMSMRGVQKPGHLTTTSALRGVMLKEPEAREEFLSFVSLRR